MKFAPAFTDHAVLAAHRPIRIYGDGEGRATVTLADFTAETVSESGRWYVEFPPMEYGGPYELKLKTSNETITLSDIYIGEVYLFSGQSNMQFKLGESNTPVEEYENIELLRYFSVRRPEPGDYFQPEHGWVISRANEVTHWSSIAYIAARAIALCKGIAVGAICCAQGASVIESWVPRGTFEQRGVEVALDRKHPDHGSVHYGCWNNDGFLYNTMLSQVVPYSLTGVVWYQGESDTSMDEGAVYAHELRALVEVWRRDFCDPNLPFIIVQLADYAMAWDCTAWKLVQEAQAEVGETTVGVTTVICGDVCEDDMIHPVSKYALSQRIAEALMRLAE